tara:strand:- start:13 stop:159 length:147 start_codon:yes stop_codon:yes gene_type:complete
MSPVDRNNLFRDCVRFVLSGERIATTPGQSLAGFDPGPRAHTLPANTS